MEFFHEAEAWVVVSFLLFIGVLIYFKVPKIIGRLLDEHHYKVKTELDQARNLREEAEKLLASYKQKQVDAEAQAKDIIASAHSEAEAYGADARKKLDETLARRTKQAETKIAQAQDSAEKEIRAKATDLAISAAGNIIAAQKGNDKLIAASIKAVRSKAN